MSVEHKVLNGGQPSPLDLSDMTSKGVKTVINLRAPSEDLGFDEAALCEQLNLDYRVVAIAGPEDLVDLHAVDGVAHPKQRSGTKRRTTTATAGNHADKRELGATGKQQRAQRHGLPETEPRRHRQGSKRDAVQTGCECDRQPDPKCL